MSTSFFQYERIVKTYLIKGKGRIERSGLRL